MNKLGLSITNNQNLSVFDKISDGTCSLVMDSKNSLFIFKSKNHENQVVIDIPNETITGAVLEDEDFQELVSHQSTDLHYHDADRSRANHSGSQLSSTISDLSTTIGSHSDVSSALSHANDSTIHLTSTQKTGLTNGESTTLHIHDISDLENVESYVSGLISDIVGLPDQCSELDIGDSPNFSGIKSNSDLTLTIDNNGSSYVDRFIVKSNTEELNLFTMDSQGGVYLYNGGPNSGSFDKRIRLLARSGSDQNVNQWSLGNAGAWTGQTDDDLILENFVADSKIFIRTKESGEEYTSNRATIDHEGVTLSNDLTIGGDLYMNNALKFYDVGTWTPQIAGGTSVLSGAYTWYETGEYVRIGCLVYLNFYIEYLNDGSHTGDLRIYGIPFLKYQDTGMCYSSTGTITVSNQNLSPTGDQVPFCLYLHYSWDFLAIIESYDNDAYSWVPIDESTSGSHCILRGTITYRCREYV